MQKANPINKALNKSSGNKGKGDFFTTISRLFGPNQGVTIRRPFGSTTRVVDTRSTFPEALQLIRDITEPLKGKTMMPPMGGSRPANTPAPKR